MDKNKIYLSLIAVTVVGLVGLVGCGPQKSFDDNGRVMTAGGKKQASSGSVEPAPQVQSGEKQFDSHTDVTPSARGCPNVNGFYVAGSFIYWKNGYTDMDIGARIQNPGEARQKHKTLQFDTHYDPGFKFGVGYNFQRDVWDVFLNWTWLQSKHSDNQHVSRHQIVTQLGGVTSQTSDATFFANKLDSRWHFQFDTVDLELGRNFYIGKHLSMRPYAGLKGAYINQKLHVKYKDVIDDAGLAVSNVTANYKDHQWGVGPRVGINTRWVLGNCNVAFLANVAGSVIWEDFHPSSSTKFTNATGGVPTVGVVRGHRQELNPIAEVFLGFDWGRCINEKVYINLSAGYEMQYWWDQYKNSNFYDDHPNNALNLHGLTTTLRFDF